MGKSKKLQPPPGTAQRKISAFFQGKPAKPTESALFSSIGGTRTSGLDTSKPNKSNESLMSKQSSISTSKDITVVPETQQDDLDDFIAKSPTFQKVTTAKQTPQRINMNQNNDPEGFKTPTRDVRDVVEVTPSKGIIDTDLNNAKSPDGMIPPTPDARLPGIPDTPESDTIPAKKLPPSRSFLPSVSIMSSFSTKMNKNVTSKKKLISKVKPGVKSQSFEDAMQKKAESEQGSLETASSDYIRALTNCLDVRPSNPSAGKNTQQMAAPHSIANSPHKGAAAVLGSKHRKRTSSKGESPNPKRPDRRKSDLKSRAAKSDTKIKRRLHENTTDVTNDQDEVLNDILNEMKDDDNENLPNINEPKFKTTKLKEIRKPMESPVAIDYVTDDPVAMETDQSQDQDSQDLLNDILDEIRQLTPQSQKQKPRINQYNLPKTPTTNKYIKRKSQENITNNLRTSPKERKLSLSESPVSTECAKSDDKKNSEVDQSSKLNSDINFKDDRKDNALLDEQLGHADLEDSLLNQLNLSDIDFEVDLSPVKRKKVEELPPCSEFGRHNVIKVEHSKNRSQIFLSLESVPEKTQRTCILSGFWADTYVKDGDVVHILSNHDNMDTYHIDDLSGYIIVNPDKLVSGTTVVSTVHCMRKSILNEIFKGVDSRNIHMLNGTVLHEIFQKSVIEKNLTTSKILKIGEDLLKENSILHDMYALGVTETQMMEEVVKSAPQILAWKNKHMIQGQGGYSLGQNINDSTYVTNVTDIEENVWSPRFGIKGKIDLTVEVKIHSKDGSKSTKVMPLELKTGRPTYSIEHKGQVTLYSLMSSDRREDPHGGLLVYLKDGAMTTIPAKHENKRGLLQLRNELSHYLTHNIKKTKREDDKSMYRLEPLAPPIDNERSCTKCPHLVNCSLYQKTIEERKVSKGHIMESLVPDATKHLNDASLEYFALWCLMMSLESQQGTNKRSAPSEIWCKTAKEREAKGECMSNMVLSKQHVTSPLPGGQCIQAFRKHSNDTSKLPLSRMPFVQGDSIIISSEKPLQISLCMGYVRSVSDTVVMVTVDRDLSKKPENLKATYRIDKCDSYNSMTTNFVNLSRLMSDNDVSARLRDVIINKRKPEFEGTMSKTCLEKVKHIFKNLNKPQKTAILKVLLCRDYVLIKGYPGTGKTSTIVSLVRILSLLGRSVLLASYTHSAVDNILLKLVKCKVDFLRVGRVGRIHPDILPYAAENLTQQFTNVEDLKDFYSSKNIVATTCLGATHPIFGQRKFDVCIIDEASQVLQPTCFGPLFCSKKFVLVGDPQQLPPVVQNKASRELGMSESLFLRLDPTGATYELNLQYRMNR
ncbi:unnamed protein product [Owenia fusiformis]|uniref:DNA replication ATP-dependent helicase/nuclease DNA2 n=1 Tax=Owenia fusiformis TaxID=6347 RepID=A0A8S4Q584_OWEFU|nr:unnamed protein product [Owenia fusiformis]